MSDLQRMTEILEKLEILAADVDQIENRKIAGYVEGCLRTAYEDIQVECVARLDHGFQVV
jgi:hypothetical protein